MYIPKDYIEKNQIEIDEFIENSKLSIITCNGEDGFPLAVHLPLVPKKAGDTWTQESHLALANPICQHLLKNQKVLIIIQGADGYISSGLYEDENVPTWNYQIAHLYCRTETLSDEELHNHLDELMQRFESERQHPVHYKELSDELIEDHIHQIKGFRWTVEKIEMATKLSQNRNDKDYQAIIEDLEKCPIDHDLQSLMKKHRS
jgi:transcriptional regulator